MKILVADDERISLKLLAHVISTSGHESVIARDGQEALQVMTGPDAPSMAILDWMMPGMHGVDVCRAVRHAPSPVPAYLLLLTSRTEKEDIVTGLDAGADDYLTKPFDVKELQARIRVGVRVVQLQIAMAARLRDLEEANARVNHLHGLLPICAWCKNIRNDRNYWQSVEEYLKVFGEVRFSHSVCPPCLDKLMAAKPATPGLPKTPGCDLQIDRAI